MAKYIDGFLIPVPQNNVEAYRTMARKAGKIWLEYGALEVRECVGDDINPEFGVSFSTVKKLKPDETVFFSWIVYNSKSHRNKVNAQVMKDPRIAKMCDVMPFDAKRMSWGGFKVMVDLGA